MENNGRRSGIWLLWNKDEVHVDILLKHFQFLHTLDKMGMEQPWLLFFVMYANQYDEVKEDFWRDMNSMA